MGGDRHVKTVTRQQVLDSTDVAWLYEIAGYCDYEPAEPDRCPNCLAYMRAQEIEDERREANTWTLRKLIEELQHLAPETLDLPVHLVNGAHWSEVKNSGLLRVGIENDRVLLSSAEEE